MLTKTIAGIATFWSALTCQRFVPVATCRGQGFLESSQVVRRQAVAEQSGDRSTHSKELPLHPKRRLSNKKISDYFFYF